MKHFREGDLVRRKAGTKKNCGVGPGDERLVTRVDKDGFLCLGESHYADHDPDMYTLVRAAGREEDQRHLKDISYRAFQDSRERTHEEVLARVQQLAAQHKHVQSFADTLMVRLPAGTFDGWENLTPDEQARVLLSTMYDENTKLHVECEESRELTESLAQELGSAERALQTIAFKLGLLPGATFAEIVQAVKSTPEPTTETTPTTINITINGTDVKVETA